MILVFLGDGVVAGVVLKQTGTEKNAGGLLINIAWGLAVVMAIYASASISGAHLNPAVTLGLAVEGSFPWEKVPGYIIAQILGAMLGAALVWMHYLPHWRKTEDAAAKLGSFCTSPAIPSTWSNLLSEILGTFVLVAGVLFIGANKFAEGLNPIVVGALVISIGMSLGGTTGYAINPARDLGPRLMHAILPIHGKGGSNWGYAWIPVLGPVLGGLFGAAFYCAAFKQNCNPWMWGTFVAVAAVMLMAVINERKK
jgi:glycerol uptake facilitator protein